MPSTFTSLKRGSMPARSRKQQRYLYRKFGKKWVKRHHFDKIRRKKGRK